MGLSIQTQNVNNLYILFSSLESCLHKQIFTKQQPYNKYEKGSLGVPRMFWVPNTFPLVFSIKSVIFINFSGAAFVLRQDQTIRRNPGKWSTERMLRNWLRL